MEFEYLETERMHLRRFDGETLKFVFEHYTQPELRDYFGVQSNDGLTKPRRWYEGGIETYNKKMLFFHLIDKTSKKVIGWCGYHTWYIDHRRAEIGYGLFQDNWKRKGLMTEAMEAVIDYGFGPMNLNRVEAFVSPDNAPSIALMKRFQFQNEGLFRQHFNSTGALEDSSAFGLLREDYLAQNRMKG